MSSAEKMNNAPNIVETCVMNYVRKRRALCKITPATAGVHLTAVVDKVTSTLNDNNNNNSTTLVSLNNYASKLMRKRITRMERCAADKCSYLSHISKQLY
jgi:hypothetical protein